MCVSRSGRHKVAFVWRSRPDIHLTCNLNQEVPVYRRSDDGARLQPVAGPLHGAKCPGCQAEINTTYFVVRIRNLRSALRWLSSLSLFFFLQSRLCFIWHDHSADVVAQTRAPTGSAIAAAVHPHHNLSFYVAVGVVGIKIWACSRLRLGFGASRHREQH